MAFCHYLAIMDIESLIKKPGVIDQIHRETGRSKNSILYWGRRGSVPAKFLPAVATALGVSVEDVIAACAQPNPTEHAA